jgi:protein TonB
MSAVVLPQGGVAGGGSDNNAPTRPSGERRVADSQPGMLLLPGRSGQLLAPATFNRSTGLIVVVAVHLLFVWALASGLAREAIEIIKKPIQMVIVPEVVPPPPPPPPPKVEKVKALPKIEPPPPSFVPTPDVVPLTPAPEPVVTAVQAEPPKEPVVIAPPPPPAPEPKPVVRQEISLACPGYQNVLAQTLEDAFERVGIAGTVRTRIAVRGSQVVDAVALSGPKEYYKIVQAAIKRMRCSAGGAEEVQVMLDVQFKR